MGSPLPTLIDSTTVLSSRPLQYIIFWAWRTSRTWPSVLFDVDKTGGGTWWWGDGFSLRTWVRFALSYEVVRRTPASYDDVAKSGDGYGVAILTATYLTEDCISINQPVMIIVLKDRARSLASRTLPPSLRMKEPVNTGRKTCVAVFPVLSFLCHPSDRSTRPGNPGFSNTHTADEIAARLCLTGVWTLPACWGPVWGLLKEPSSEKFLTSIFFFLESVRARGVL
ncbi:hypothetical protein M0657_000954 [Pyricularia oryzae]|nr:hypothetical protein M9X92_009289 [Pyricularia oryzae]KAI7931940.1 hypothetical protein M0657_000954 [Pyricularia oryzae]